MSKIVFAPPGPDTPGYLRRVRGALEYQRKLTTNPEPEAIDSLVEFLLPYVEQPADRDEAREALWDASANQFNQLLSEIVGRSEDENPT